jgi:voltage-gated potassium channel
MGTSTLAEALAPLELFRSCSRAELRQVDRLGTWLRVDAGRVLCREGEVGREFFVLLAGSVTLSHHGRRVRTLTRGAWFGETALVARSPHGVTVTTDSTSEVLVFDCAEFTRMLDCAPRLAWKLLTVMCERVRVAEAERDELGRTTDVRPALVGS